MAAAYDIIVLGDYFYDIIYSGLPGLPELGREMYCEGVTTTGGALYITVVSLTRLGAKVGWPAYFGDDYYSRSVYGFARGEGVDLSLARQLVRPYRRVTTALPYAGERAFVTYTDPEADDLYDYWLAVLQRTEFKHLHVGGMEVADHLRPLLDYARSQGATVSIDSQDGPHLQDPCLCQSKLDLVDVFLPNAREARIISERDRLEDAVAELGRLVPVAVVKDGAHGAWLAASGTVLHAPAVAAGPVVDTTGAGDCFNAGFLYGYITERAPLETCLRYGNVCGGLSVTGIGGATNAPTREELAAWMERG